MPRVTGLGHVGIYVRDLERMVAFYRDVMGMRVTKQNWRAGMVFLSADSDAVDHEIALMRGGPPPRIHTSSSRSRCASPASTICARSTGVWSPTAIASRRSSTTPARSAATSSIPRAIAPRCSG
ncbi:MAG: hypothetical protein DMD91_26710 [Candidatus Rokuibacteriota bacterium]|nr:MAG: hypothetical protein DMD91_26710 [Candidatus Rokubacteria bacterium]